MLLSDDRGVTVLSPSSTLKDRQNDLKQAISFISHILKSRLVSTKSYDGTDDCPATLNKNATAILDGS